MSAWDITGAVIWSALSVWLWSDAVRGKVDLDDDKTGAGVFCLGCSFSAAAIFCIARLCGAHL